MGERFTTDWLQREEVHESRRLHHPYITLHDATRAWTHVEKHTQNRAILRKPVSTCQAIHRQGSTD